MLDLKRLSVLAEVVRRGSFSGAAEELYLSQSAVSQQVATLEREVGMSLLERTRRGQAHRCRSGPACRTPRPCSAALEEAEHELKAIAGLEGGELRIASFPSASVTLLTEALAEYGRRHPGVALTVTEAEPDQTLPRLRAADVDIAIVFDYPMLPAKADDRDIERVPLLTESMYLGVATNHPWRRERRCASLTWPTRRGCAVCGRAPVGRSSVRACREAGFEPRIAFESDEYQVLQGYVAAGLGFTLLPDLALPTLHRDLVVRPTKPEAPKRRVWAATRRKGARSACDRRDGRESCARSASASPIRAPWPPPPERGRLWKSARAGT